MIAIVESEVLEGRTKGCQDVRNDAITSSRSAYKLCRFVPGQVLTPSLVLYDDTLAD